MKTNLNDQARSEYRKYLKTKAMVDHYKPILREIAKENSDLDGWTVTFGSDQRVMFMFYSRDFGGSRKTEANLAEFVRVRDLVQARFDTKLNSKINGFLGEGSEFIGADGRLPEIEWKHGTFAPTVEIRMFGIDKCEIEYVEKTVKEPQLSGFCAEAIQ